MIPATLIKRLTPEQLAKARRLYFLYGEVFFEQKPDGTLEVLEAFKDNAVPPDGSWEQSSKFNG